MEHTCGSTASSLVLNNITPFLPGPCKICNEMVRPEDVCGLNPCGHGPFHHICIIQIEQQISYTNSRNSSMKCPQCQFPVDQIQYDFIDCAPRGSRGPFTAPSRPSVSQIPNLDSMPNPIRTMKPPTRDTGIQNVSFYPQMAEYIEPSAPPAASETSFPIPIPKSDSPRTQIPVESRTSNLYPTPVEPGFRRGEEYRYGSPLQIPPALTPKIPIPQSDFDGDSQYTKSMPDLRMNPNRIRSHNPTPRFSVVMTPNSHTNHGQTYSNPKQLQYEFQNRMPYSPLRDSSPSVRSESMLSSSTVRNRDYSDLNSNWKPSKSKDTKASSRSDTRRTHSTNSRNSKSNHKVIRPKQESMEKNTRVRADRSRKLGGEQNYNHANNTVTEVTYEFVTVKRRVYKVDPQWNETRITDHEEERRNIPSSRRSGSSYLLDSVKSKLNELEELFSRRGFK